MLFVAIVLVRVVSGIMLRHFLIFKCFEHYLVYVACRQILDFHCVLLFSFLALMRIIILISLHDRIGAVHLVGVDTIKIGKLARLSFIWEAPPFKYHWHIIHIANWHDNVRCVDSYRLFKLL